MAETDVTDVRLLINAPGAEAVFTNAEIETFLRLEGGVIKLAAAQAIDTIADNEALVSKVIKDGQLSTDGAKTADSLRKRAAALRTQHAASLDDEDEGYFDVIDITTDASTVELGARYRSGGW
jgi:hypothetical protein